MWKKFSILILLAIIQIGIVLTVSAQSVKDLEIIRETKKIALVIGNSNYQNGFSKLNSPRNDVAEMGEALKRLGFRLVGGKAYTDVTYEEMLNLVDKFTDEIKGGGVGFFYFSGHGSQDNAKDNFLIPVDKPIKYQSDLRSMALKVEFVTDRMETAGNRLNILVLDACRNNALPNGFKSGNSGLNTSAVIPSGVYIAFAARDGQTALDGGNDGYSLYTRELLKNIETPNQRLEDIFIKTRIAVKSATSNNQFPIDYGSIDGIYFFKYGEQNSNSTNNSVNPNRIKEAEEFFNLGLKCAPKDYDCKISNYSKAINLNPNDASAYYNRGNAYDNKQDYDEAIQDYTKAIELNPNFTSAYNNRGISYRNKRNYVEAIRDYTKSIELKPDNANAYFNRGNAYRNNKNYDEAIRDYTKAIELKSDDGDFYNNRGVAYKNKQNYDQAIRDYSKAIELKPDDALAYYNRGNTFDDKLDYDRAIMDFTKAIELNPNYADAYYNRGNTYKKKQNYDEAIRDFTKAIELNSKDADSYYNRGTVFYYKRNYDQAISDYNKAIELNPEDGAFYNNRGNAYYYKQNYDQAIRDYTKAIELKPAYALAFTNRADAYEKLGEKSKAEADRKKANELKKP